MPLWIWSTVLQLCARRQRVHHELRALAPFPEAPGTRDAQRFFRPCPAFMAAARQQGGRPDRRAAPKFSELIVECEDTIANKTNALTLSTADLTEARPRPTLPEICSPRHEWSEAFRSRGQHASRRASQSLAWKSWHPLKFSSCAIRGKAESLSKAKRGGGCSSKGSCALRNLPRRPRQPSPRSCWITVVSTRNGAATREG